MKRIVNTNIRFNRNREDDRQAYEYLRNMDRTKFKSYTRAVVAAVNDFFSRQERIQADPFLETRESFSAAGAGYDQRRHRPRHEQSSGNCPGTACSTCSPAGKYRHGWRRF